MMRSIFCIVFLFGAFHSDAQEYKYRRTFFVNSLMPGNYFFSKTSATGSSSVKNVNGKLPVSNTIFFTAGNSLQLDFTSLKDGNWNAIVFQQEKRGMDHFTDAVYLSLRMMSESDQPDSLVHVRLVKKDSSLSGGVFLSAMKKDLGAPQQISLKDFSGYDVAHPESVIGVMFEQGKPTGRNHIVYADNIEFLPENSSGREIAKPAMLIAKGYAMHVDLSWPKVTDSAVRYVEISRSENGKDFVAVGLQEPYIHRYADFTGQTGKQFFYKINFLNANYIPSESSDTVAASTKKMTDDELLTMVQEASFRYYWEGAEDSSGLAKENISGRHNMIATGASGFGIMALITGTERGFITRTQSVARFKKIVTFLEKAETFHGAYPHFIDGRTGKVETFFGKKDNGSDLVETAFLFEGLIAARQYFSGKDADEQFIRDKITSIWKKAEWDWFKQYPDSKFLYWHWSPDQGWVINHNLIGWNETMVTYLLAIASPTQGVPASMYYSGWANQDSTGQQYREAWSGTKDGSMYTNGKTYFGTKLDVGVSNGGPLFFTHYSYMGYDPHLITDKYTNYFTNNQNIAKINHSYCVQNPKSYKGYGDDGWGLTASDGPFDYSADEPVAWADHGKLAPTGAISSFPYTPEESMKALKNYYFNYGKFLWGEYGFRDAFDLTNNWCSEIYMGLNQAPQTVMIENYRTGLIWKLFMSDPDIKAGLKKLEQETKSKK